MIYLPFQNIEESADALNAEHWVPHVYLIEKVYLLSFYLAQIDPKSTVEADASYMISIPVGADVYRHNLLVSEKLLKLAKMWKPYPLQLLTYALLIEEVRKKHGTQFPAKSLYYRIQAWLDAEVQNAPKVRTLPVHFPWREEVYAAHRAHMNARSGYAFEVSVRNLSLLYPAPFEATKLRPTPRFERELKRLASLYR